MKQYTQYDEQMMRMMADPVEWAKHHLGDTPRWYQEQILRHPHHRKVLRCGRRVGKCIEEHQRILNPITGEYTSVGELYLQKDSLYKNPDLITLNEQYKLIPSEAFFIEDNGMKETFRVRTKYGAEVVLTGNHPVLTLDGWVEVDSLKIGDRIATPSALPYFGHGETPNARIKAIAYLLAGSRMSGGKVAFSSRNRDITQDFAETMQAIGASVKHRPGTGNTLEIENLTDDLMQLLVIKKQIPSIIFQLTREKVALFLQTLYSVSGWAYNGTRPEIGYSSTFKHLMKDIKHLLLRFGVTASLRQKKNIYELMIYRQPDLIVFGEQINIATKEDLVREIIEDAHKMAVYEHTVPKEVWNHIHQERKEKKLSKAQVTGSRDERLRDKVAPTLSKIAKYADTLESAFLYDLARSDLLWEEVMAIEAMGVRQTYDVFVPETHNLVVEDVLVHNTWTMTAHMLWVAFTCNGGTELQKGATCVVATPYDNQARLIFDQLKIFIDNNPVLQDSIKSMTKNPYVIEFKNKSIIRLFTAGTRSGSEGGSLRGQKASWLYLDEIDYMSDKDFEAIYAISLEAPKRIGIMVASTPTGRRGTFYRLCTDLKFNQENALPPVETDQGFWFDDRKYDRNDAEGWKEFYFPTMVNPEWDEKMERELKGMYSESGYEHEVLAEFGTEMVGVFNKDYIDEAASDGYALLSQPKYDSPIAIGIDWDKYGAATQIVVVQWNPYESRRPRPEIDGPLADLRYGRFQVINRIEIPKGQSTYDQAVQKVIQLDKIYQPFAIYPDRGAGEYQIEMLRKHLGDKVKGIHLGSSHMVRDPHSREFDKKPIKPFMVNQTTLILERGQLRIPNKDIDEMIHRQMTNYTVERISPKTGEPTYSSDDEHALDAMMLAILAFIIEKPDIANTIEDIQVARKFGSANIRHVDPLASIYQGHSNTQADVQRYMERWDEPTPPPPRKVSTGLTKKRGSGLGWGSRGSSNTMPSRRKW